MVTMPRESMRYAINECVEQYVWKHPMAWSILETKQIQWTVHCKNIFSPEITDTKNLKELLVSYPSSSFCKISHLRRKMQFKDCFVIRKLGSFCNDSSKSVESEILFPIHNVSRLNGRTFLKLNGQFVHAFGQLPSYLSWQRDKFFIPSLNYIIWTWHQEHVITSFIKS